MCCFLFHGVNASNYPAVVNYLKPFRDQLEKRATSESHEWYELQQPQMGIYPFYSLPKIVYPDIAKESRFAFDVEGTYFGNSAYMLASDDFYLLGVLNSSTIWWLVKQQFACLGDPNHGGRFRFFSQSVETIPIPNPPAALRAQIAAQAQACLDVPRASHPARLPALEAQLNALVYFRPTG